MKWKNTDIINTAERLLLLKESDFDISTGLLVNHNEHHVFVVQNHIIESKMREPGMKELSHIH
jgi:hypothetical protein